MLSRTHRSLAAALSLVLATGTVAAMTASPAAHAAPAAPSRVAGIDVASHQHPSGHAIDWSAVGAAGYRFAVIKATESTTYRNPYFAGDRAGARAAGLVVGAYHYARPAKPVTKTADAQARYFVGTVGTEQLTKTLPPVLDLEATGGLTTGQLSTWAKTWLNTVQSLTGRTPMLYSYDSFLRSNLGSVADFAGYPLWYARYQSAEPTALPGAWTGWHLWQRSSTGAVPGISGDVDLNVFAGTYAQLLTFATGRVPARPGQVRVKPRERTHITGRVDPAYAGERVIRAERTPKGVWHWKKSHTVHADGTYSFRIKPVAKRVHHYRVLLRAASPYAAVRSETFTVTVVKPSVHAKLSRTKVHARKRVAITGHVDSCYAGERIVRYGLSVNGRWHAKKVKQVRADGTFRFWVRPSSAGTHHYKVRLTAKSPKGKAESRVMRLRVR